MTTATTTGFLQRADAAPSPHRHRARWLAAAGVGVAAATMGLFVALDGSDAQPASGPPTPVAVTDRGRSAGAEITSADAAERRSLATQALTAEQCAELAADAAERCMSG